MNHVKFLKTAIFLCSLQSVIVASDWKELSLKLLIAESKSNIYAINNSQPINIHSATRYDGIISKIDREIRDQKYSHINQDLVKEIDRENCCNVVTAPCLAVISVALFGCSHDLVDCLSRWTCERRIEHAMELQSRLQVKKNQ